MIATVFSQSGVLAKAISGFQPRQSQTDMALAVGRAIDNSSQLIVEAGTGTGKTFAYLVPALLSQKKIIISTGSKNLQEQLYHRDLPLMVNALGYTGHLALLKGRSNYLCQEKLSQQMIESHDGHADVNLLSQLVKVRSWSCETKTGDLGECSSLTEDSPIIPTITSTNDNCLGKECPSFSDCFVVKARKRALDADLIIVNHHLFLADIALKETGFGEIIPHADVFIFDEAHQLSDIASQYFGERLSSRQLQELAKDIYIAYRTELRDTKQLEKVSACLSQATSELRIVLGEPGFRGNWREVSQQANVARELTRLCDALSFVQEALKLLLGRSQLLDAAFDRSSLFKAKLERLRNISISGYSYWFECSRDHFSLNITPLCVAEKFKEYISSQQKSWIFTSATLTVNDDFKHFTQRLGLEPAEQFILPSPFDYPSQAILCVPRYLNEPNSVGKSDKLVEMLSPIIELNKGRCFFLCTSYQMMRELTQGFRNQLTLPVLMQGETSKQNLLDQFLKLGNALLVATGAFWEGVDVRGAALSCVIIDKLPFTSPEDPLLKARIEECRLQGGDPFLQVQIPDAVITLKQGVGRLIRDNRDYGALIICDNRLVNRYYGSIFLQSLPPIPRTRDLTKVGDFLSKFDLNHDDNAFSDETALPEA